MADESVRHRTGGVKSGLLVSEIGGSPLFTRKDQELEADRIATEI